MCDNRDQDHIDCKLMLEGDVTAFERLFRRYYPSLCSYCQGIVGARDEAEDIVQDVYVYLWENRKKLHILSIKTYLYSSVRHGALRQLKRQELENKHSSALAEFIEDLQRTEYSEEEIEKVEQMKKVLQSLPPQCRTVFLMNCLEEKTYKEIAEELNISVNTVKTHITKAYRVFRGNF